MKLLLDTNALLWWLEDHPRLGQARDIILSVENDVLVSVVSLWESVIKAKIGKLRVRVDHLEREVDRQGFRRLAISSEHLQRLETLEMVHRDPFDHMIIAQAQVEGCTIVTSDAQFTGYRVPLVKCG